jgi:uncharacterized protein DUF6941
MRTKIILADSAEVREGLLFLLGGAWNVVGPAPQPFAIAGVIEVDWGEANQQHTVEFAIDDVDGNALMVPSLTGEQPFRLNTPFEVGRPPGSPQGTTFNVPVAMPIPPIPWVAGRHYVLIVSINGVEYDRVRFTVRQAPAVAPAPPAPQR